MAAGIGPAVEAVEAVGGGIGSAAMTSLARSVAGSIELKPVAVDGVGGEAALARAWGEHYERVYEAAGGDASRVPWADAAPSAALLAWLNEDAPGLVRPGAKVTVVGCGLGHDAAELATRGYDVHAFDVSPTAVAWARRLHPAIADRIAVADLLELPAAMCRRADAVVEIGTLQSLPPPLRACAARAVVSLARPKGLVVAIARARGAGEALDESSGPPYPLTREELGGLLSCGGMAPMGEVVELADGQTPPTRRLRGVFRRG